MQKMGYEPPRTGALVRLCKFKLQEPKELRAAKCWAIRKIYVGAENVKATFKPQPGGT